MRFRCLCWALPVLPVVASPGCAATGRADYSSSRRIAIPSTSEQGDRMWEAAQETLRRHSFRIDRVDRRAGVITTMPVLSQHFFEIWRKDVATRADFWEAAINPIRRWVEISLSPDEEGEWSQLEVAVHKERLSTPDRQFNSTGAVFQYFGGNLPSTTGLVRITPKDEHWLDLGRDPAMEEYLLERILARAETLDAEAGASSDAN